MSGPAVTPRLSLCGPGRAGRAFLRSWLSAGGLLGDVVARQAAAAERAVRELQAGHARGIEESLDPCDIFVLAVPDDAIALVAASLAARVSCRFAFHLSGALGAEALAPLRIRGAAVGSLHPLRAFTGAADETWRGAFVAVEGETKATEAGLAIARTLGALGHVLPSQGKALYHAGAQLAAGGTAAAISLGVRAWEAGGLDPEVARAALGELAAGAAAAVAARPFEDAFTGAVARRDLGTIGAHIEVLASLPDVRAAYARLAAETLARTPGRGREEEVRKLLARWMLE